MKRILSLKHWQLFLLIVITAAWSSTGPLSEIIHSVSLVTFTCWIYSIGIYGQERVEALHLPTLNTTLFKINIFLFPLLLIIGLIIAPEQTMDTQTEFNLRAIIFIPIVLYCMFAGFHIVMFAFKTLATIELKREVTFDDYVLNLILTGIFIFGIWILQPKITTLIADTHQNVTG
jgi:hypothetical protein